MKKSASRPPLFEVRHSPVHGYGVFALRRIRKGTTVTEYLGERISHDEADSRYENKDPDDNHTFLFTVDSKTVIDGGVGGNDARYINHGCDPNCESTTLKKRIYVEAVRTIEPGEELAYDYQIERDPEDPPNVDEIFACRCGAVKCRGSMLVAPKKPRKKAAANGGRVVKTVSRSAPKKTTAAKGAGTTGFARKDAVNKGAGTTGFARKDAVNKGAGTAGFARKDAVNKGAGTAGFARKDAANKGAGTTRVAAKGAAKKGVATKGFGAEVGARKGAR
jgi:uncharacterized protein